MNRRCRIKTTAEKAWIGLVGIIVAYEVMAEDSQLLTHGARRFKAKHPVAAPLIIGATALHLLDAIPRELDPYSHIGHLGGRILGRN